ncbi:Type I restriction-modification system methyltransferase subunit [Kingella potus]|uniref:site-specific DNA-methyltransferase (adenine-specific) n=1 Tax=Kingella potus TaxID=265175 RepID=A0A377QY29_9NEIS|nr:DNA methyltransferase [Kingella potus]STQ99912.1 Type I restriction-modification system methyltransferase subunit [Kingella potus]
MTAYTYEHKYRLAQAFARRWKGEKREEAEAKTFWDEFFRIFNLDRYKTAVLEYGIKHHRQKTTKFADVFWAGRLLCEHKSANKDLDKAFEQAAGYVDEIRRQNPDDVPRHIIVCDFAAMRLYDLQAGTRTDFPLEDLPEQIKNRNFDFMDGIGRDLKAAEEQANIEAADSVGGLFRALAADTACNGHHLKQFIIRLLFCFFADDTLIFDPAGQFESYLAKHTKADGSDTGSVLNQIFHTLNTPPEKRPARMNSELKAFPYVNGRLFAEPLEEFYFDADLRTQLLECSRRDWAKISPEIFGSLFQSVMDGADRRAAGAHYTEEANILKVIDSLFMDGLRAELAAARKTGISKSQRRKLVRALHEKIGRLNFLDPACGCGNFLVVAYRELRRLEDDIIGELFAENQLLDIATMQRLHIGQFHGIELDEYPAQIAKVAMWLTDHQCNRATAERFGQTRPTIPLTDSAEIINANALATGWPQADYIFGNPPFIGSKFQNAEQRQDMKTIAGSLKNSGVLDYVAAWYLKAADMMENSRLQSITPPPR